MARETSRREPPVREGRVVDRQRSAGRVVVDVERPEVVERAGRRTVRWGRVQARVAGRVVLDDEVRIVNPPTLVPDPEGDVVLVVGEDDEGNPVERRYRHDPEGALVEVLAQLAEQRAGRRAR